MHGYIRFLSRKALTKIQAAVIAVIIIVAVIAGVVYYVTLPPPTPTPTPPPIDSDGDGVPDSEDQWPGRDDNIFPYTFTATSPEPDTLDPHLAYSGTSWYILNHIYSTLVRFIGEDITEIHPALAESWDLSADGKVYTLKLREGVKFYSGDPLDAECVKYSLDRLAALGGPAAFFMTDFVDEVEVVDDLTVRIHLKEPYAGVLYMLAEAPSSIVNKAWVEAHGGTVPGQENTYVYNHTDASGPYQLVEWEPATKIVLEANENYWEGWEGKHVKKIIFRIIPEVATREMLIGTGDIDQAIIPTTHLPELEARIETEKLSIKLAGGVSLTEYFIFLNTKKLPFSDKNARLALIHLFDYDSIISDVLKGYAIRMKGLIPEGMVGFMEDYPSYEYDPELAAEYLAKVSPEALEAMDGMTWYMYYGIEELITVSLMVKSELAKLGIELNIVELDWPTFLERSLAPKGDPEKADVTWVCGWSPDYLDTDGYVHGLWETGMPYNLMFWGNETTDAWLEQAAYETDLAKRTELYRRLELAFHEDACCAMLYQTTYVVVQQQWVKGYIYNPSLANLMYYHIYKEPL